MPAHEGRSRRLAVPGLAVVCLTVLAGPVTDGTVGDRIVEAVQLARRVAGVPPLVRRADLDAAAMAFACDVAARPPKERLQLDEPVERRLREDGITDFRRVFLHLQMRSGAADPARSFIEGWYGHESDRIAAISARHDAIGLGICASDDGWLVLTAILLEQKEATGPVATSSATQLRALEQATLVAANEARAEHGAGPLSLNPVLTAIARSHSEDMVRRGYFDHRSPEGHGAADRLRAFGVAFRRLGENLHKSRGADDPARAAVRSWLKSGGHRKTLLEADYRETGVGVALDPETGVHYLTQLYLTPPTR